MRGSGRGNLNNILNFSIVQVIFGQALKSLLTLNLNFQYKVDLRISFKNVWERVRRSKMETFGLQENIRIDNPI